MWPEKVRVGKVGFDKCVRFVHRSTTVHIKVGHRAAWYGKFSPDGSSVLMSPCRSGGGGGLQPQVNVPLSEGNSDRHIRKKYQTLFSRTFFFMQIKHVPNQAIRDEGGVRDESMSRIDFGDARRAIVACPCTSFSHRRRLHFSNARICCHATAVAAACQTS